MCDMMGDWGNGSGYNRGKMVEWQNVPHPSKIFSGLPGGRGGIPPSAPLSTNSVLFSTFSPSPSEFLLRASSSTNLPHVFPRNFSPSTIFHDVIRILPRNFRAELPSSLPSAEFSLGLHDSPHCSSLTMFRYRTFYRTMLIFLGTAVSTK